MAEDEPWYATFNDIFWLTLAGSVFAFFGVALRACLKSRCTNIACCSSKGIISCDRQPIADENLDDLNLGGSAPPALERSRTSADLSQADVEVGLTPSSTALRKA